MRGDTAMAAWIAACLLLGLRVAPVLAFAPPFTSVRVPALFRVWLGLGLSVALVSAGHLDRQLPDLDLGTLLAAAVPEAALGLLLVLIFQLAFGALNLAGRVIDVQAGFGLALLIDPSSRAQVPLVGTLFTLAASAIFFALDGHLALLRLISASIEVLPLGSWHVALAVSRIGALATLFCSIALGFAGVVILTIFLIDIGIALLSRTVPQMNVLVLGFQVKTLALLVVLPLAIGAGGAALVRLLATATAALPALL
jgi:flagellar biosynthetic protein FliR